LLRFSEWMSELAAAKLREGMAGLNQADVRGVEACRLLRLTQSLVDPLSFVLPRSEKLKEWFQGISVPAVRPNSNGTSRVQIETALSKDPAGRSTKKNVTASTFYIKMCVFFRVGD